MPYKDPEKRKEAKRRYEQTRKGTRFKVWTLIFYPDSAPGDWPDLLSDLHLRIWVSPVHDQDMWTEKDEKKNPAHKAGEKKKPHFHLVVEYVNPISASEVKTDFACLNGASDVKHVRDKVAILRYLIHKDDPQKAQYRPEDVRVFGGADADDLNLLGTRQRHEELKRIRAFIEKRGFVDFYAFCLYCDECEDTWSRLIDDNSAYIVEKYIKSYRAKVERDGWEAAETAAVNARGGKEKCEGNRSQ